MLRSRGVGRESWAVSRGRDSRLARVKPRKLINGLGPTRRGHPVAFATVLMLFVLLPSAARGQHTDSVVFVQQDPPRGAVGQLVVSADGHRHALHVTISYNDPCNEGTPQSTFVRIADTLIVFFDVRVFGTPAHTCPAIYRPVSYGAMIGPLKARKYEVRMRVIRLDRPLDGVYLSQTETVQVH